MALELLDLGALVHRHFEREAALGPERSQCQLTMRDVAHQAIGATSLVDFSRGIFRAPATTASEVQIGESLPQRVNRIAAGELRTFAVAPGTTQYHRHVGVAIGDDAGVLNVACAQLHQRAAPGADGWLAQRDFAAAHQPQIEPIGQAVDVPHDHAEPAARRHVRGDTETDRCDGEGDHDFHPLALAIAQPLAVAPRRQLDARRFADAHEVIALPADQCDLIGGRGDSSLACGARYRFDALQAIIEWGEIPAAAAGADDPQPPPPFIESDSPPDAKPRGAAITVKRRVTKRATAEHPRK